MAAGVLSEALTLLGLTSGTLSAWLTRALSAWLTRALSAWLTDLRFRLGSGGWRGALGGSSGWRDAVARGAQSIPLLE